MRECYKNEKWQFKIETFQILNENIIFCKSVKNATESYEMYTYIL